MNRRQLLLGSSALVAAAAMPVPVVIESTAFGWQAGFTVYPFIRWKWDEAGDKMLVEHILASEVYIR